MRAWAVALSLLAGCDYLLGLEHVPDRPVQPDAALYCHAFPVDAAFGSDPDLDNKPSQEDNCPDVANAAQYDEDNDCRGDACDLCPWQPQPDPDMGDGDNDKIGDDCDPSELPNELYFDGFNDESQFPIWHDGNASFVIDNGALTHTVASGIATALHGNIYGGGVISFALRLPVATLGGSADFFAGAWVLGYMDLGPNGVRAGLVRDAGRYWLRIELVLNSGVSTLGQYEIMGSQLPDPLRISVGYANEVIIATLEMPGEDVTASTNMNLTGGAYAGVVTVDTIARWDYFVQIN